MKKVIFVVLFSALSLAAQNTASISGTVTDASGAAVANAAVTVTNIGNSMKRETVSNNEGQYVFELLPVGEYRLEAGAAGFKKFIRSGIVLNIDQSARIDAPLTVGAVTENVTVQGGAPLVNTENATLGRVTENQEIVDLPIVDRNVYSLLTLTAGVENSANGFTLGYPEQRTNINGGADGGAGSVNYYLDGGANMDGLRNTGAIMPNPDAIQEFKLLTNSYSSEYGHSAGGVIIAVTKSGTNALHGSLFEFLRNDKMSAYPWNFSGPKPALHRNEFGAHPGRPHQEGQVVFLRQLRRAALHPTAKPQRLAAHRARASRQLLGLLNHPQGPAHRKGLSE